MIPFAINVYTFVDVDLKLVSYNLGFFYVSVETLISWVENPYFL